MDNNKNNQISVEELGMSSEDIISALLGAAASNQPEIIEKPIESAGSEDVNPDTKKVLFTVDTKKDEKNTTMSKEDYDIIKYRHIVNRFRQRLDKLINDIDKLYEYPTDKNTIYILYLITDTIRANADLEMLCEHLDDCGYGDSCFSGFNNSENVIHKITKDELSKLKDYK